MRRRPSRSTRTDTPFPYPTRFRSRRDRRLLAVIADCAALALAGALGRPASGSSLDNAIRFLAEPVSEWTLARMRVEGIGNGIAHVSTRLFAQNGALLAVADQSMLLRAATTG